MLQLMRSVLLSFSLFFMCSSGASEREASEYELKAVFLYNLAKFTQWPQGEQKTAEFINLCVTDQAVFDGALAGFQSKKIGNKHFKVREVKPSDPVWSCHLLFVDQANEAQWRLKPDKLQQVLTIGESKNFLERGGLLRLYINNEKLSFIVQLGNVRLAGLEIDSRLLRLAKKVEQ